MSADPLLDLLRGAIPEGGKLTLQAFNEFLDTAIANADNFFNFNETTNVSNRSEPPRVCRRPFGLSYAAMAGRSSMA